MTIGCIDACWCDFFLLSRWLPVLFLLALTLHRPRQLPYRKNVHIGSRTCLIGREHLRLYTGVYDLEVDPDRIVISGFGCLTPLGNSKDELWEGFRNARSGVRRISAFDP